MKRAKDIIAESRVDEADVLKRNPLQPTYDGRMADRRRNVVVDDLGDDIETLDGRINARGRAEPLRKRYVDDARRQSNRSEICTKYCPMLEELAEKLAQEGFRELSGDVQSLADRLVLNVEPEAFDMGLSRQMDQIGVRRPIYVGGPGMHAREYRGHSPLLTR